MARQYITSLVDPFNSTITQPKLYDGAVKRSSGLRFRSTGNITLEGAGLDNYIVLFPCFSQGLSWRRINDTDYSYAAPYTSHFNTVANRQLVKSIRLVSSGLKLQLMNNADDNEGYWEAVRIPMDTTELGDLVAPTGEDGVIHLPSNRAFPNLADYPTFQTGLLRDLDRFMFKLNSTAADHPFTVQSLDYGWSDGASNTWAFDRNYDIIVIRLVGRINATTPSVIRYEHVSNQEVVYRQDSMMAKLATTNTLIPNLPVVLDRVSIDMPAIQIN